MKFRRKEAEPSLVDPFQLLDSPVKAAASAEGSLPREQGCVPDDNKELRTFVAGRRHHAERELDTPLSLQREPNNSKDGNAILVRQQGSEGFTTIGYIPAPVAACLSSIFDYGEDSFQISVDDEENGSLWIRVLPEQELNQRQAKWWGRACDVARSLDWKAHDKKESEEASLSHQMVKAAELAGTKGGIAHLFTEEELTALKGILHLADENSAESHQNPNSAAQAIELSARMFSRKSSWYTEEHLKGRYARVPHLHLALAKLIEYGLLELAGEKSGSDSLPSEEAIALAETTLPAAKLKAVALERGMVGVGEKPPNTSKAAANLMRKKLPECSHGQADRLRASLLSRLRGAYRCFRLNPALSSALRHAISGITLRPGSSLSRLSLAPNERLGTWRDMFAPELLAVFPHREHLLEFEKAYEDALKMAELHEENIRCGVKVLDIADWPMRFVSQVGEESQGRLKRVWSLEPHLRALTAEWWWASLALNGAAHHETEGRRWEAIGVFQSFLSTHLCDEKRGKAYVRLCVNLERHLRRKNEAMEVAAAGIGDPAVMAGERYDLMRRYVALCKPPRSWRLPHFKHLVDWKPKEMELQGRPLNCKRSEKSRFGNCSEGGDPRVSVEQLALQVYKSYGWQGMHAESQPFCFIFLLLFWDIIFGQSRCHPLLPAPLDFGGQEFLNNRRESICARLKEILSGWAGELMELSWRDHYGSVAPGANWERHCLDDLLELVSSLGPRAVATVCAFLASGYSSWAGGFPDIALWGVDGGTGEQRAKLVEVKGPRDTLSQQQRAWLVVLASAGVDVEVARVSDR